MAKFLYFQDMHFRGKNSRNRLGNYFAECLAKLDEIISIAKDNNCDAILDGGDIFESDKPSYSVLDAVADRIEKGKIPLYSLFGNHAMSYGHIENSDNTGLTHLQKRSKYFLYLNQLEDLNFIIKPIEYNFEIENKIKRDDIIVEVSEKSINAKNEYKIAIVHALVTQKKFFEEVSHVQCKDIKTNADLVLVAHYHKPYIEKIGNTTFLNIGCCGRDNIDEAQIEPSVVLLDTDERSYQVIKLKSAKKANEIFDLAKYEELKANKKDIKEFLQSLKSINLQSMDLGQQIVRIGKEQNVDKNIVDSILETMKKVTNE